MSGGFSFGANTSTPGFGQPAFGAQPTGSITFGTPVSSVGNSNFGQPAQQGFGTPSFSGFGGTAPATQNTLNLSVGSTAPNPGFGFGATPASTTGGFGFGSTPASSAGSFGFGAQQAAAPAQQVGFGSGSQPAPATGGFGLGSQPAPATGGFGFGATPASQASASGFGFAATPTSIATGLSFGATPIATATGFSLGAPASSAPNMTFNLGAPSSAPNTTFNLGAQPAVSTGFGAPTATGFGTQVSTSFGTPVSTGLNYGAPVSSGLNFGAPTSTTLTLGGTSTSTGFGLGTATTSTGLNYGSTAPSTGFSLTQPQTTGTGLLGPTSIAGGLSFGPTTAPTLSLNFGTTTTTSAPTLSFGTPTSTAATSSAAGTSFNFGGTLAPSVGLGGTSFNLSTSKPATTAAPSLGLGGIVQSTPKTGTTTGKTEVLPRDQSLPNEISQTVESFKNYVKQQKSYSSEIARCSVKEFKKVAIEIDMVANLLNEVEKQLQTNRAVAEKIKVDTAKGLQHIEMAQRTFDTPPGLQYDNTSPMEFFTSLVDNFEREMHTLKIQIESTDKYVKNLGKPAPLNSQDLSLGMRRLHEAFVALAGRLQSVHSQVESQKEQYLNVRKYMLNDDTNIFEKPKLQAEVLNIPLSSMNYKPPAVASGPTPFNSMSHPSVIQAAVQNQTQPTNTGFGMPQPQPSLFGTQTGTNLFGNTTLGTNFGQPQQQSASLFNTSSSFQLQKPPTGNKRSK